jgi:hypothetical protein
MDKTQQRDSQGHGTERLLELRDDYKRIFPVFSVKFEVRVSWEAVYSQYSQSVRSQ